MFPPLPPALKSHDTISDMFLCRAMLCGLSAMLLCALSQPPLLSLDACMGDQHFESKCILTQEGS